MGVGDQLMATGMARGAKDAGQRVAFGDGQKIIWDHYSEPIFRGNPNIAPPGSEGAGDLFWIKFYKGHRIYNRDDRDNQRWIWNYDFRPRPGEVFLNDDELTYSTMARRPFILIEPNVPTWKAVHVNKQWPESRYQRLAAGLRSTGLHIRQPIYPGAKIRLTNATPIPTPSFRHALALMARAALVITSEGGFHHGAAAVGAKAVVIFGGFIPPQVTGYDTHINLAHGEACGSYAPCDHCRRALEAIEYEQVHEATLKALEESNGKETEEQAERTSDR